MNRRATKEGQRLAEDLARVIQSRPADPRLIVDPDEARRIRAAAAQERRERRETSAVRLLQAQWIPWVVGGAVFVLAAACWLLRWLFDPVTASMVAALAVPIMAWVAWMAGRRGQRWRRQAHVAAGVASVWLLYAVAAGPTWRVVLLWMASVVLSSSSWWKAHRPAHPKAPSRGAAPVLKAQSIVQLWAAHLGASGAVLAGSVLTDRDDSKPNCESYTINLRPGKQTITGTLSQLELIAGGLSTPVKQLVLEPHPDHNPNHVKLTVVQHSPIEETVKYKGARIVGDHRNMIEVGPYGDGDGYGRWRMWQPGEKPMTGSWLSGLIIAGTGIGKSRLMELLAAGYMASGCAIPWFNDPQGGASSPALQEYADWYTSSEGLGKMISALERAALAREKENSVMKWSRFDPTPERPGIVVFLDEGHVAISRYGDRLEALARKTQKVGIGFVVLTQGASLESLGKDILRACLMANVIVMKTMSNQTKNLLPGLPVDPEMLPKIPGFGYIVGTDGSRTAPLRAECQDSAEYWFKRYAKMVPALDALTANAIGNDYQMRQAAADQEQEANRLYVEQLRGGVSQPTLPEDPEVDEPAQGGSLQVARFPSAPSERPQDQPSWQRVLSAVAQGVTRPAEIQKAVGLGKSQTAEILKQLLEDQHLEQPTRGVYAIAGSASEPVR